MAASLKELEAALARAVAKGKAEKVEALTARVAALVGEHGGDAEAATVAHAVEKRNKLRGKLATALASDENDRADDIRRRITEVDAKISAVFAAVRAAAEAREEAPPPPAAAAAVGKEPVTISGGGHRSRSGSTAAAAAAAPAPAAADDEDAELVAKWQRKLAKAVSKGKEERADKYRAKLAARGVAFGATVAAGAAGDESLHERALREAAAPPAPAEPTDATTTAPTVDEDGKPKYPPPVVKPGNVSLLLFYAYVKPHWTGRERMAVIEYAHGVLSENGCTGRLRVALEGMNSTLTGPAAGVRAFTAALRSYDPANFGATDFKIVDGLADNKAFKALKVWPVEELVTYGFAADVAPLEMGGTHLTPAAWTDMAARPDAVIIDVRNANETAIGWFQPPEGGAKLLDPRMRRSTEFPAWVDAHMDDLRGKQVMMFCTAGIRCERASALLGQKGLTNIFQLEGGIHRYLDAYPDDGGIWVGKNYTFDKRFSHGAAKAEVVGRCSCCNEPWERYQAQAKCAVCRMETLLCRTCERSGRAAKMRLKCWLCKEAETATGAAREAATRAAAAHAATNGRSEGEGEGRAVSMDDDGGRPSAGGGRGGVARGRGGFTPGLSFRGGRGGRAGAAAAGGAGRAPPAQPTAPRGPGAAIPPPAAAGGAKAPAPAAAAASAASAAPAGGSGHVPGAAAGDKRAFRGLPAGSISASGVAAGGSKRIKFDDE